MTVSSSINKVEYAGNGITTVFAFPYLFYSNSDLKVYINGVLQSSGYTVTGVGTGSGNVTFSVAPANGVEIIILRTVPYVQNTDFTDFDGNPSIVTEKALDLLTMQTQQLAESQSRIVSFQIGSGLSNTTLPDPLTTTSFLTATLAGGFQWASLGSISTSIDTLFTGLASGDLLTYNGTKWVNAPTITTTQIANNAVTFAKLDDDILAGATTATITATDIIAFGDVSDTNKTKRTTVQGILDLIYMVGELKDIAGTTIPSKWLQCNGAAVSRTTYSALFAVIGTTYGAGDGSTTFNVPDFRRRTAVGSGGTGTATLANTVGSTGGAETHTLTIAEMPSHTHEITTSGTGGGYNGKALGGQGVEISPLIQSYATGGGQAHNNMQPSLVVTKIIYAGV